MKKITDSILFTTEFFLPDSRPDIDELLTENKLASITGLKNTGLWYM